jgi:hypothetical protein
MKPHQNPPQTLIFLNLSHVSIKFLKITLYAKHRRTCNNLLYICISGSSTHGGNYKRLCPFAMKPQSSSQQPLTILRLDKHSSMTILICILITKDRGNVGQMTGNIFNNTSHTPHNSQKKSCVAGC